LAAAEPLEAVDTHIHLYDMEAVRYPWRSDPNRKLTGGSSAAGLPRNHHVGDLLHAIDGVEGGIRVAAVVQVEGGPHPADFVRETGWLDEVARHPSARGFPQAIVAGADLAADDAEAVLAPQAAFPAVRGIRQALHRRLSDNPPYDPLADGAWLRNFDLLRRCGLCFDLQAFPQQTEAVCALIGRHADVLFILTHCGLPLRAEADAMAEWAKRHPALCRLPEHRYQDRRLRHVGQELG
jgi:predicted TIM-barrel fold metal-dependent hydrolase